MAFYMKPGQGSKMKTGGGVPSSLMGGPKMKSCGGPMMTDPDDPKKKPRPVKGSVSSTTEDLGRGARRTTINTTSEFAKPKGKNLGADYKPSKAATIRANKQVKLDKQSKKTVITSKGVSTKGFNKAKPSGEIIVPKKPKRTLTPPSRKGSTSKKTATAKVSNYFKKINLSVGKGSTRGKFKAGCLTD